MLEGFVDGRLIFTQRDRRFLRAGRVGLHVFMAKAVRFRGYRLTSLDEARPDARPEPRR